MCFPHKSHPDVRRHAIPHCTRAASAVRVALAGASMFRLRHPSDYTPAFLSASLTRKLVLDRSGTSNPIRAGALLRAGQILWLNSFQFVPPSVTCTVRFLQSQSMRRFVLPMAATRAATYPRIAPADRRSITNSPLPCFRLYLGPSPTLSPPSFERTTPSRSAFGP